jgi:hypothetical protein
MAGFKIKKIKIFENCARPPYWKMVPSKMAAKWMPRCLPVKTSGLKVASCLGLK